MFKLIRTQTHQEAMMHDELRLRLNTEYQKLLRLEAERERLIQTLNQSKSRQNSETKKG